MTVQTFPLRSLNGVFINRNYAFLWVGQAVSSLGDSIYNLTLIVWIAAVIARQADGQLAAWAPIAVSGVLVAVALPFLFFGSIAGVFVDRWDKKQTMLWMDLLRMVLVGLSILVSGSSFLPWKPSLTLQLGAIYATVFLISCCSQLFTPARAALIGEIVEEKQLARASGLAQVSQSMASIIGPPLAAPVLFGFGIEWALIFNALTFLVSFLCIRTIQVPGCEKTTNTERKRSFFREFTEGVAFSFKNSVMRVIFVVVIVGSLGAGAINSLMIFFVAQNLHLDAGYVGVLDGVFGGGTAIGALLLSLFADRFEMARLFTVAILAFGILFLLFARTSSFVIALIILPFLGLTQAAITITFFPLVLGIVPRALVGRVMGTLSSLGVLAGLLSVSLAGYLASGFFRNIHGLFLGFAIGPIDTIFTLSAVLYLISGIYALLCLPGPRLKVQVNEQ